MATGSRGVIHNDFHWCGLCGCQTSRLVWADWENSIRRLGWLEPKETRAGRQWGEFRDIRDIVGNPSHDLVSWVQRGAYSGGIVISASKHRGGARPCSDPVSSRRKKCGLRINR